MQVQPCMTIWMVAKFVKTSFLFSCSKFYIYYVEITIRALYIEFRKPMLNRQQYSQGSSFILNTF